MEKKRRNTLYKKMGFESHAFSLMDVYQANPVMIDGMPHCVPSDSPFKVRTTVVSPQCPRGHRRKAIGPIVENVKKVDPIDFWFSHTTEQRMENCNLMKICMLWPVFMQESQNETTCLRTRDPRSFELSINELNYIELLEDLANLYKELAEQRSPVEEAFTIGINMVKANPKMKNFLVDSAMLWIKDWADYSLYKKLKSHENIRHRTILTFFKEYCYYILKMSQDHRTLSEDAEMQACKSCGKDSEHHKKLGKDQFARENFTEAEDEYTKAIYYSPENHLLFSNRALCYIRMQKYGNALADGKKSIILKNNWPKGHYWFCEALFSLGEMERAIAANERAQELCKDSQDDVQEQLQQQHSKFKTLLKEASVARKKSRKKSKSEKRKAAQAASAADIEVKGVQSTEAVETSTEDTNKTVSPGTEGSLETVSGTPQKKGKSKGKNHSSEKLKTVNTKNDLKEAQKISPESQLDLTSPSNMVNSLVLDASVALLDQRFQSAEGMFSQVIEIVGRHEIQSRSLTNLDHVLLLYGHANALLGIRKSVALARAENRFKEIIYNHSKERFNCLAFYGIGNVYLKQNRYSDALNQYVRSKTMLMHKMCPGVLTWPTTSIVIEETRPEKLEIVLINCIEECKFPPKPDAICRYKNCLSLPKIQIYFTDPDFKGFIRMVCCQYCIVEFHVCCWKKLKAAAYPDQNDKDFLRYSCLTPDCSGVISHIVIYDYMGEVKCEFEDKIIKKKEQHKPAVKNKGTSVKKHKAKHENKTEKKKAIEEELIDQPLGDTEGKRQEKILPNPVLSNGYHIPWDPLLSQVMQKQQLIIRGCPASFPNLWESLTEWKVLSPQDLSEFDKNTGLPPQSNNKMKNLLNHLYKLNNRVKTRVLLYLLKIHHEHISSDLYEWILILDEKGLDAAEEFRVRNEELLRSIKPKDVQSLWNKSYGKIIDHKLSDFSGSLYDILTDMFIENFRCVVWFLEENRNIESIAALGKELDKYFQEMDVPCSKVPAYSLQEFSNKGPNIKAKHRKKKQNQPKPIYKLSGAVSTRSQEDDIFTEENTLSLLDPYDPFVVPDFLQRDIEEFNKIYEADMLGSRFVAPVDDFLDPVRETLYEYFYQILEEHGPLNLDDEILIGEYKNFPEKTQRMVEASGGLKDFLLESYLFTMMGDMVTITDYDIAFMEDYKEKYKLNPSAKEFKPSFCGPIPENIDLYSDPSQIELRHFSSRSTDASPPSSINSDRTCNSPKYSDICSKLDHRTVNINDNPTADICRVSDPSDEDSVSWTDIESSSVDEDMKMSANKSLSQENNNAVEMNANINKSSNNDEGLPRTAIASVQVNTEMSHCEVNTDAFQPFESRQGDILRMEKEQTALSEQLKETKEKYESAKSRYQEDIANLEEQIKDTVSKNKITKTELNMLQQDYERVSKKWHQEKKEIQEKIKALKNNIKKTVEESDRCSKTIEEKKKQYEAQIKDFAQTHYNKFDKEKATLEKQIKKKTEEWEETKQRTLAAEVLVLENRKQCEILKIKIKVATVDRNLGILNPAFISDPAPHIVKQYTEMESLKLRLTKEMKMAQAQFDEKMDALKSDLKPQNSLESPVSPPSIPIHPPPNKSKVPSSSSPGQACAKPANPTTTKTPVKEAATGKKVKSNEAKSSAAKKKAKNPPPTPSSKQAPAAQNKTAHPGPTLPTPAKPTLFDKIIHELHDIFPHYRSAELTSFMKDFRSRNNGTLSGFTQEEVISRVTEYILDFQTKNTASQSPTAWPQAALPPPKQPWKMVNLGAKKWQNPNDLELCNEDPCIICHDELKQFPMLKLDCGHCFHKHCIKTWLNTQSTCPTCREHALLPEDFPALSGTMRTV